jgi:hypothetical protein
VSSKLCGEVGVGCDCKESCCSATAGGRDFRSPTLSDFEITFSYT